MFPDGCGSSMENLSFTNWRRGRSEGRRFLAGIKWRMDFCFGRFCICISSVFYLCICCVSGDLGHGFRVHPFCLGRKLNKLWVVWRSRFYFDSYRISGGDWIPGFGRSFVRGVGQGCLLINIFLVKTMYGGIGSEWNERTNSSMLFWKGKIFSLGRGPTSSEHERCKSFILTFTSIIF